MKDFRDLKVWEKAHQLALLVYRFTKSFPKDELYGLTSQLRRSAMSVPSNIAEGCGRGSDGDFARFVQITMGSASEVEYQLLLSRDLDYIDSTQYDDANSTVCEVKRMLASLLNRLRGNNKPRTQQS